MDISAAKAAGDLARAIEVVQATCASIDDALARKLTITDLNLRVVDPETNAQDDILIGKLDADVSRAALTMARDVYATKLSSMVAKLASFS